MAQKLKPRKALGVPTKNTKHLYKSTCYAVTNLKITSSCILSLLSPNSLMYIAEGIPHVGIRKSRSHDARRMRTMTSYLVAAVSQH